MTDEHTHEFRKVTEPDEMQRIGSRWRWRDLAYPTMTSLEACDPCPVAGDGIAVADVQISDRDAARLLREYMILTVAVRETLGTQ